MRREWTEEQKQRQREIQLERHEREKRRPKIVIMPAHSGVSLDCSIRLDMDEMTRLLTPAQIHAVMHGMAQVLAAGGSR